MQIIDLFSGVGGFSIAGHQLGWETILFCEKEPFPQQVLRERFPGVPIFDNVCKLKGETINGLIQSDRPIILTGGFPCQPFSVAGAREGTEDDRHLWPEMFRIIKEVRPDYVIGENVPGLLSIEGGMVFEQVCLDLESEGYEVQAFVLPACATGAPHRRDRVWIVAADPEGRRRGRLRNESEATGARKSNQLLRSELAVSPTPNPEQIRHRGRSNTNGIGTERQIYQDFGHNRNGIRSEIEGCDRASTYSEFKRPGDRSGKSNNEGGVSCENRGKGIRQENGAIGSNGIDTANSITENTGSSGCENGEYDKQGDIGNFGEFSTGGTEWNTCRENGSLSDTNEIGINRCSKAGSNEGQQPTDSEQSGGGWASEACGYVSEWINSDTGIQGHQGSEQSRTHGERPGQSEPHRPTTELHSGNYWHDWPSISPFHSGHDGLSPELVRHIRTSLSEAGETPENIEAYIRKESNWLRKQAIMAAGNAIVPQVVLQVMKAIENHYNTTNHEQKN